MPRVFVSFAGREDPYGPSLIQGDDQLGPVLTLLEAEPVDGVTLLSVPGSEEQVEETRRAVADRNPKLPVEVAELSLEQEFRLCDLTAAIGTWLTERKRSHPDEERLISVRAGTSLVRAAWLLLAEEGNIEDALLDVRPRRYLSVEKVRPRMRAVAGLGLETEGGLRVAEDPMPFEEDVDTSREVQETATDLGCLGDHPRFRQSLQLAATLAEHGSPILLEGETGTGKDVFARFIHQISQRRNGPFVPVNCAALPDSLAESLLFGHRKGAFTGAMQRQTGKFQLADNGILFLDELAELSLKVQAKLLRVLEDGLVEPLGATSPTKVNVRVVAATNRDLQQEVVLGNFREDLYYRLRVGEIWLPPLRERRTDIPKIALHFLERVNQNLKIPRRLSKEALDYLQRQTWPGNVRDLQNVIERTAMLSRRRVIEPTDLSRHPAIDVRYQGDGSNLPELREGFSLEGHLSDVRRRLIEKALDLSNGNQSEAARLLGVTPQAVHKYVKTRGQLDRASL